MEQGREEGKLELVPQMLKIGLSDDQIMAITQLSQNELDAIKNKL